MPSSVVRRERQKPIPERTGSSSAAAVEGGDDGVVYLGRGSFKMKIGVRTTTPPTGTPVVPKVSVIQVPPPRAAPSPLPTLTATPLPVLKTPMPIVRRPTAAHGRTPAPAVVAPSGGATARTLVIG